MGRHLMGYYGPHTSRKLPMAGHYGGGFLYVIAFDLNGPSKVGITVRPRTRLNELRRAAGAELVHVYLSPECTNYGALESQLHGRLKAAGYHHVGEWFKIPFKEAAKAVTLNLGHFNRARKDRYVAKLARAANLVSPVA